MLSSLMYAVSFALADSVNALLIGVTVAIGIMLPRGQYKVIAPLLILGDWTGVFLLSILTMLVFDGIKDYVDAVLESPVLGWILILIGLAAAVMAWRQRPGESNALVQKMLGPLRTPSPLTFLTGLLLGLAQSITSGPFFIGLLHLSAGDFSAWVRYGGLAIYASLALSLPTLVAVFVGIVRRRPESAAGRLFAKARENKDAVTKTGSYVVAAFLVFMGLVSL